MELFLIYIWLKLGVLTFGLVLTAIVLCIVRFVLSLARGDLYENQRAAYDARWKRWQKWTLPVAITALVFAGMLPSKTDVAILVGAKIAIDVASSPEGAKVGAILRGKVNELLDEELKQLAPKK